MRKKNKRTPGVEEAHPFSGTSRIHPYAAGVDIGAIEIVACVPGGENTQIVKAFGNYTVDLQALAQWIQTLHTYGLLEGSFRLQGEVVSLRTLLRHRSQLVEHRSPHVQHMQKALLQMNVQLSQAVTDVTGMTGLKIMRAILAGERDPHALAALREPGCKKSAEEIGKALTGTWRDEHLFVLQQSVQLYDFYTQQIQACDEEIERLYGLTRPDCDGGQVQLMTKRKKNSHSKNLPQHSEEIRKHLKRISGVDLTSWMVLACL